MNIIVIDLGKFNSTICFYDPHLKSTRFRWPRHKDTISSRFSTQFRATRWSWKRAFDVGFDFAIA